MSQNFSEKKKELLKFFSQIGPMNMIRLEKEEEGTLSRLWAGIKASTKGTSRTHFSSSQMSCCTQIDRPVDHVHFEDCHTLDRYLNLITDIEVEWFVKCCEKVTHISWEHWHAKNFFNVRAYVHWMKWGAFLKEMVYYVEPKRMKQTMHEMFASRRDMEAMLLLTHGQLTCYRDKRNTIEFSSPVKLYCPCLDNGTLINVQPWGASDFHEGHPLLMRQFSAWHDISCIDDIAPSQDVSMEEEEQPEFSFVPEGEEARITYNWDALIEDPVEEKWVVGDGLIQLEVIKPSEDPMNVLEKEMGQSLESLDKKPQEEGLSVEVEEVDSQKVLVFTHEANLDNCHLPLSLNMPLEGLTISQQKWMDTSESLLPLCLYPSISVDYRPFFSINGVRIMQETGPVYLTHWHVNRIKNNCSCCGNTVICRAHGAVCFYLGRQMSVYCGPYKGDVFHVPRMIPQTWITNSWTRSSLQCVPKFKNMEMRMDLRWAPHPYTFPCILPGDGSPISYFSRVNELKYEIILEGNYFHFRVGPQIAEKNFLSLDLLFLLFNNMFELDLVIRTVHWIFKFEQSFSRFHLEYMKLNREYKENKYFMDYDSCILSSGNSPTCGSLLESLWNG
jgi:hypothetical protein